MREKSYGQENKLTLFDRFGTYLSCKQIKKVMVASPNLESRRLLDLGAGYDMVLTSLFLRDFSQITAVDVELNEDIYPSVNKLKGALEDITPCLSDNGYEVIILNSVLEHIAEPQKLLCECNRILARGGIFYVSVPQWLGKVFLEFTAFRLNIPHLRYEMNDHKMYYGKRDIWPMLVRAGFLPENIRLSNYKFGLNLLGVCKK